MLSQNLLLSSFLSLYCTVRALLSPLDCLDSRHCLLSTHVFISLPSIPTLSLVHSSIEIKSTLSIINFPSLSLSLSDALLHLLLSFSLPISDSCSFKFMLMIFPNLISESRDWGWLYWALKVIGLQKSHTVALLEEIQRIKRPTNITVFLWVVSSTLFFLTLSPLVPPHHLSAALV